MFRAHPLLLAACALAAASVAPLSCSSSSGSDSLPPITGITVRAETLIAGRGCGRAPTQIFKYAAVVLGRNPGDPSKFDALVAGNVYDCFADGQFVDLPPSADSYEYDVQVYAYNEAAYRAAGDAEVHAATRDPSRFPRTNPTLTTTCTALQIANVQTLAVCKPFPAGTGSIALSTASFALQEGGTVRCNTDYETVRYRPSSGDSFGAAGEARCSQAVDGGTEPVTITIAPVTAPASYLVEVALLRADGTLLGETTCTAETSAGATSAASCKPIP